MKTTISIIISVSVTIVLLVGSIIYFMFFSTIGLVLLDDNQGVKDVSQIDNATMVIGDDGCCYIRGTSGGMENKEGYQRLINSFREDSFVRIYAEGDAERCYLSYYGGAIVTNGGDAYIFKLSYSPDESYKTPELFASDTEKAFPLRDSVILLGTDDSMSLFDYCGNRLRELADDVLDFVYAPETEELLYLRSSGELCVMPMSGGDENVLISDIVTFDMFQEESFSEKISVIGTTVVCANRSGNVIRAQHRSLVTNNDTDIASCFDYTKTIAVYEPGEVDEVCCYDGGLAVLREGGDLELYGEDIVFSSRYDREYNGEVFRSGVTHIDSDIISISILTDGKVESYGWYLSNRVVAFAEA